MNRNTSDSCLTVLNDIETLENTLKSMKQHRTSQDDIETHENTVYVNKLCERIQKTLLDDDSC